MTAGHHGGFVAPRRQRRGASGRESGERISDVGIREAVCLPAAQVIGIELVGSNALRRNLRFHVREPLEAVEEPARHPRQLVDALDGPAASEGLQQRAHAPVRGDREPIDQRVFGQRLLGPLQLVLTVGLVRPGQRTRMGNTLFQGRPRLEEGLFETATDGHDLAGRLHAGAQRSVGRSELVKGPSWNLDHAVVEGRLEGGRGPLARDRVWKLVEGVPDGDLRRHPRDGVTRGLRRQGRGTGHAWVDLDDPDLTRGLVEGELNVAAALDVERANEAQGVVTEDLVVRVAEGLQRRHHDRLAGVHTHRVDVFHRAHDGGVVRLVAHDLVLEFLPAEDGLLDEHLVDAGVAQAKGGDFNEFTDVARRATTEPTKGERRANQQGPTAEEVSRGQHLLHGVAGHRGADREANRRAHLVEQITVFRLVDGVQIAADEFHAKALQRAVMRQLAGDVERGLTAHAGEQGVRALGLEDGANRVGKQGFDVDDVGHFRVVLNRRGVGVDQDHLVAVLAQGTHGLRTGEIEFGRLPDLDWTASEHHDGLKVFTSWHQASPPWRWASTMLRKRVNNGAASWGPGQASGWNWTVNAGRPTRSKPSTVRSLAFT